MQAIFAIVDFAEHPLVPFDELSRILRFMYRTSHTKGGSIADNLERAQQLQGELEGDARKESNPLESLLHGVINFGGWLQ